jgi:hypothetical protein
METRLTGAIQRFFSLGDLLKDRIGKKGLERQTGDVVQALVQIGAFGKNPWSYFGQVRQTLIENKTNRKLMAEAIQFSSDFQETTRQLQKKEAKDAAQHLEALRYAIANGWNDHARSAMQQCRSFIGDHGLTLAHGPEPVPPVQESDPSVMDVAGQEISLKELYHYELVKPNSSMPRTFTLPYSLFRHSPQRRYTETNEGAKTKYKMYSFFMLVFTMAFNTMSFLFIGSAGQPGKETTNYVIVPILVSMFWLVIMWYIVKLVIGTTWVHTPYLVPFGERSDANGPQPMLLVNSQSMDLVRSISAFLHISQDNIDAMGETMKSFQEATYSRLKLDNRAKDLKIASLEDESRKSRIQEETGDLNGQKVRIVRRLPRWAVIAIPALLVATGILAALLSMLVVSI